MRATLAIYMSALLGILSLVAPPDASAQEAGSPPGVAPLVWPECKPDQIQVLVFGTFHFSQSRQIDVLTSGRQEQLGEILARLERWAPRRIAVEFPFARQPELDSAYHAYRPDEDAAAQSSNEITQLGLRLGKRLDHEQVYAVDVPMNLWHDSIGVFDETWPEARVDLRRRWSEGFTGFSESDPDPSTVSLAAVLRYLNHDTPPANWEMYGGFLPLVKDEFYVGALKLRPWYDRNLRILQNLFRVMDPSDDRVLLIIGTGHLRVLKQMMEMTPQICPVSALPLLADIP